MKISELKKLARTSLNGNWGQSILLTFIIFALTTFVPMIVEILLSGGFLDWLEQEEAPLSADISSFVITIVLLPLTLAVYWFYLSLVRYKRAHISNVFTVYKNGHMIKNLFITSILSGLFVFLWSCLLIIPGIIKAISYSQAIFILRDHPEFGARRAIKESRKRMVGYKWKYFVLQLSFIGWGFLSIVTLGIGFLWFIPYFNATLSAFYQECIYSQENKDSME